MTGNIGGGLQYHYLRYGYANGHCLTHLPGLLSVFCWDNLFLSTPYVETKYLKTLNKELILPMIIDGPRLKGVL